MGFISPEYRHEIAERNKRTAANLARIAAQEIRDFMDDGARSIVDEIGELVMKEFAKVSDYPIDHVHLDAPAITTAVYDNPECLSHFRSILHAADPEHNPTAEIRHHPDGYFDRLDMHTELNISFDPPIERA